jgi:hypothetical protein
MRYQRSYGRERRKKTAKSYAALRREIRHGGKKIMPPSGWKAASISRVDPASSLIPNRRNDFWTKCAAAASRR